MRPDLEKLAVLKMAGYEVMKCDHPPRAGMWDWNWFVDGVWVTTSEMYHRTKTEAINDAWLTMHERLNTPKEVIA